MSPPSSSNDKPARPTAATNLGTTVPSMDDDDAQVKLSVESYQLFITFVFSVSIFGASTFAVVASQMADPADVWHPSPPPFGLAAVRNFLAVAWLCFILAIAVAGYSLSVLYLHLQSGGREWLRKWKHQGIVASVVLHGLLVAAFMFLSLAMVAYVGVVGWVGVGFCSLAGVFVGGLSVLQWRQARARK